MQDAPQTNQDSQEEVQARLAQINAALAAAQSDQTATATAEAKQPMVGCPIDPAERAMCEGCQ